MIRLRSGHSAPHYSVRVFTELVLTADGHADFGAGDGVEHVAAVPIGERPRVARRA